jgi:hypothetical protein
MCATLPVCGLLRRLVDENRFSMTVPITIKHETTRQAASYSNNFRLFSREAYDQFAPFGDGIPPLPPPPQKSLDSWSCVEILAKD